MSVCVCLSLYLSVSVPASFCLFLFLFFFSCFWFCLSVSLYMYICICVCVRVCVCVCINNSHEGYVWFGDVRFALSLSPKMTLPWQLISAVHHLTVNLSSTIIIKCTHHTQNVSVTSGEWINAHRTANMNNQKELVTQNVIKISLPSLTEKLRYWTISTDLLFRAIMQTTTCRVYLSP